MTTRFGCAWLHYHWASIAAALTARDLEIGGAEWTLASDLLGIPEGLRRMPTQLTGGAERGGIWSGRRSRNWRT